MRTHSMPVLAVSLLLTLSSARGDLLLDTGTMTNGSTDRGPSSEGFGQGVSAATTSSLHQFAMLFESPSGGNFKYMIWNGTNSTLLSSDTQSVSASNAPEWILSDPLSFSLKSGNTYYFGAFQDSNTELIAPYFFPPVSVTQNGLTTLSTGNSNYDDFITPVFTALAGGGFPLRLYGTQGISGAPVPEPSLLVLSAAGFLAIALRSLQAKPAQGVKR